MALSVVRALYEDLSRAVQEPGIDLSGEAIGDAILKLKVSIFELPVSSGVPSGNAVEELLLTRDILEFLVFLSIRRKDLPMFERHILQVLSFYSKYCEMEPKSVKRSEVLGLRLMQLLAANRREEFHTLLAEIIVAQEGSEDAVPVTPAFANSSVKLPREVSYAVQQERFMTDGAFKKVYSGVQSAPSEYLKFFGEILLHTVRNEAADCLEHSSDRMSVTAACEHLFLPHEVFQQFAAGRSWDIDDDGFVHFPSKPIERNHADPSETVTQCLDFAAELEKIV